MDLLILVMLVIHLIMNSIILFRLNRDDWEWQKEGYYWNNCRYYFGIIF